MSSPRFIAQKYIYHRNSFFRAVVAVVYKIAVYGLSFLDIINPGDIRVSQSLFVLGSFAAGNVHHGKVAPYAKEILPAVAPGSVYKLEVGYPVYCHAGDQQVAGHLIELVDSTIVIPLLDQFHGYNLQRPEKSLFLRVPLQVKVGESVIETETYSINPKSLPKTAKLLPNGDWQSLLATEEPMTKSLTDTQKAYIKRLGASTGREIVPINLQLYRELMNKGLVVDKGRRLSLTSLGKEVYRFLEE